MRTAPHGGIYTGKLQHLIAAGTLALATLLSNANTAESPPRLTPQQRHADDVKKKIADWNKTLTRKNDADTIDIKVVVDKEYAIRPDWKEQIEKNLQEANEHFKEFGIKYQIDAVEYFDSEDVPTGKFPLSGSYRLTEMSVEHSPEELDSVLGFSGEYAPGVGGIAYGLGDYALVFSINGENEEEVTQHELSHNWGTIDYPFGHPQFLDDSVMSYLDNYTPGGHLHDKFDTANAARIRHNKDRTWPAQQDMWKKIRDYIAAVPAEHRDDLKRIALLGMANETSIDAYFFTEDQAKAHPDDANVQYTHAATQYRAGKELGGAQGKKMQREALDRMKTVASMDMTKTPGGINFTKAGALNDYAWYLATELDEKPSKEDLAEALVAAQEAVKLSPDEEAYLDTLGVILHKSGNADEALVPLTKARDIITKRGPKSQDTDILQSLLKIQTEKKDYDGVRTTFDAIIKADPYDGSRLNNYGWALCETFGKDHDKAVELAKESIKWAGEKDFNTDTLGWALHKAGKSGESIEWLLKAADNNVKEREAYQKLTTHPLELIINRIANKTALPDRDYLEHIAAAYHAALRDDAQKEQAKKTAKDGTNRLNQLVNIYLTEGKDFAKAVEMGEDAFTLDTDAGRYACARSNQRHGLDAHAKNDYTTAVKPLERAIEVGQKNVEFQTQFLKPTYRILAECYRNLGRTDDAQRAERTADSL